LSDWNEKAPLLRRFLFAPELMSQSINQNVAAKRALASFLPHFGAGLQRSILAQYFGQFNRVEYRAGYRGVGLTHRAERRGLGEDDSTID